MARIIAFTATVYVARVLGPASYGIIEFAAAIILYFHRIADGGVDLGLGVREIAAARDRIDELAPAILTARLAAAAVLAVALSLFSLLLLPPPEGPVLAAFSLTLLAVGASTRWIHLGLEKARWVSIARTLGEILMVGLVIALVRRPDDLIRVPLARFAGDALAAALLLWWLRGLGVRLGPRWNPAIVRPLLRRAWPLVASALLGLMIYNSDLIFIRLFTGRFADVGFYAAAYTLIGFLSNLGIAYSLSLLPTLTRLDVDRTEQGALYQTALAHVFAAGAPIAVGGALLAGPIMRLVFGPAYEPSVLALQVLVWAIPLGLLRDIPIVALMSRERESHILRLTGVATALYLLLNLILIPTLGIIGAAIASVVTEAGRMALAFVLVRREGFGAPRFSRLWRTAIASGAMGTGLLALPAGEVWMAVPIGAALYVAALAALGGVRLSGGRPTLAV